VNRDYSLALVSVVPSGDFGPDSIAERDGIVYVTNVDRDGVSWCEAIVTIPAKADSSTYQ
jgi:hypothetical protein